MSDFDERLGVLDIPDPGRTGFQIIGAVILALAVAALAAPFAAELSRDFRDLAWVAGAALLVLGLLIISFQSGIVVDRTAGTAGRWSGFVLFGSGTRIPVRTHPRPLSDFTSVKITREERRQPGTGSDSNGLTITLFPVRVYGQGEPLVWGETKSTIRSRRGAEALAKALGVDLVDATSGTTTVRKAEHLDESIRDRTRRTEEQPDLPFQPSSMRAKITPRELKPRSSSRPRGFSGSTTL